MKHAVPPAPLDNAAESGAIGTIPGSGAFTGHLRVREATAEERKEFASLVPERDCGRWVEQTVQSDRSWAPVVERFGNRRWIPIGLAMVDAKGQMAFGLLPSYRGKGFASAAIRAVIQYLREYPLTVLRACVDPEDLIMAEAYRRAGFVFSGRVVMRERILDSCILVLRQECPSFNVWI